MKRERAMLIGGAGLGAGLMYLMDPDRGRRRRAHVRDQAVHAVHVVQNFMDTTSRDMSNRARGMVASTGARLHREQVSDDVLVQRVRARIGRVVSHPSSIQVSANSGRITLSGPILAREVDRLISAVSRVPGVHGVENRLEAHQEAGDIPGLQGSSARPMRYAMARENWPPAVRLLTGTAGGALALYGAGRRDIAGAIMSVAGLGLLSRSATNLPMGRLTGMGAGPRAIDLRKTINIAAPVEEVFAFCSHYENFSKFMSHIREVKERGDGYSHWVVDGPGGMPVQWDAVITKCIPNQILSWKSTEGAMVENAGSLRFDRNPDGTTRLDVQLCYNPPAGAIGHAVATLFGAHPRRQMNEDLVRLKSLIEEGKTSSPAKGEIRREQMAA